MTEINKENGKIDPRPKLVIGIPTKRECQIADLFSQGKRLKEAAFILGMAPKTASVHMFNLYKKIGVTNAAEMTRKMIALGYITLPEDERVRVVEAQIREQARNVVTGRFEEIVEKVVEEMRAAA